MSNHLLLLCPSLNANGTGEDRSNYNWILELSKRIRTRIFTSQTHGRSFGELDSFTDISVLSPPSILEGSWVPILGRKIYQSFKPYIYHFFWKARKMALQGNPLLLHHLGPLALRFPYITSSQAPWAGCIIGPIGGSLHSPPAFRSRVSKEIFRNAFDLACRNYLPGLRKSLEQADLVIGVAPYIRGILSGIKLKDFQVMPEMGFSHPNIKLIKKPIFFNSENPLKILFIGRMVPSKGLPEALKSLSLCKEKKWTFTVIGEGRTLEENKKQAKLLGISKKTQFLGWVKPKEIPSFFQTHDLFLFPSYREPSGNVVMEALSFGLPPIVADFGGPGYLVTKDCGWKIPVGSRDVFCASIAKILDNVQKGKVDLNRMATHAITRAYLLGNWGKKVEWMLNQYDKVLNKKGIGIEKILR